MIFSLLALGAASASAMPALEPRWTTNMMCRDFYADIYAESNNTNLASVIGGAPADQQILVQSGIDQFAAGSTVMQQIAAAPQLNVSGTYQLWFEYCKPANGTANGVFQTVHGIVGNAGYWNVMLDGKSDNSFAASAAAAGWATLSYDRLGVGRSAHPDGINVVQISYEAAQAVVISQMLRAGKFPGISPFSKVVGVGHSYGSNLLTGTAATNPDAFDALVLTGFTNNATMGPLGLAGFASTIAAVAYPDRFGSLNHSYVITPSVSADQMEFFHYPNYTQEALTKFTTTKGEYSLGQENSIASPLMLSRAQYTHPVFVVTGANDAPYCAANCSVTSLGSNSTQLDTARSLYPSVATSNFSTYVVPDTGHGINFHTTAYMAYQEILQFLQNVSLA